MCPINNVIFVKTHAKSNVLLRDKCEGKTTLDYRKAIFLIRNPFHSIIADFNRRRTNKTSVAAQGEFKTEGKSILVYYKHIDRNARYVNVDWYTRWIAIPILSTETWNTDVFWFINGNAMHLVEKPIPYLSKRITCFSFFPTCFISTYVY